MDDFKKEQKKFCIDYSPNSSAKFGCPCCRAYPKLSEFLKETRKIAKHTLKQKINKFIYKF
jgi:hypothetical protein